MRNNANNNEFNKKKHEPWIVSGGFVLCIAALIIFMLITISNITSQVSVEEMSASADEIGNAFENAMKSDEDIIRNFANSLTGLTEYDGEEARTVLGSFAKTERISRVELLLPGNRIYTSAGNFYDTAGTLIFDDEAKNGIHVSDLQTDYVTGEKDVIRVFVPISNEGQKVAILCGVIKTDQLSGVFSNDLFDVEGSDYLIVDGESGDVICDSSQDKIDSIFDLSGRTIRGGKTLVEFNEDLQRGITSHFVFKSNYANAETEVLYEPMNVNDWRVIVRVPSDELKQKVASRKQVYMLVLTAILILSAAYIVWMYFIFSKEARNKQKRLDVVSYIYGVEKMLFSAHQKKEKVREALIEIARLTEAQLTFYALFNQDKPKEEPLYFVNDKTSIQSIKRFLKANDFFAEEFSHPEMEVCRNDYVVIPIIDSEEHQIGVLGASKVRNLWQAAYILRQVSVSFAMLGMNIHTYDMIKEMGEMDALTGVLNRNCFERKQNGYASRCRNTVSVIYVDVNGLHELNNEQGHEAGDAMLRFVANAISSRFGCEDTYRMGGDEFVAVAIDVFTDEIEERIIQIEEDLAKKSYHAAIGYAYREVPVDMTELTKQAETIMFDNKSKYYQSLGNDRRRR